MTFRDRLLTPAGARAVTSPGAIVGAGAVAAGAILGGLAAPLVVAGGLVAYAGVVASRLPKGPEREAPDPKRLQHPWRGFVNEALDAKKRFDQAVKGAPVGPIRTRLRRIGDRVEEAVHEVWRIAKHGQSLDEAAEKLEPPTRIRERLGEVEGEMSFRRDDPTLIQTAEALRAQLESSDRIAGVARDTREKLKLLDARLDETVARAVELSLRTGDAGAVQGLGSDVDDIVTEMEALRLALEETPT